MEQIRVSLEFDIVGEFTRDQLIEGLRRCLQIGMDEGLYSDQCDCEDAGVEAYRILPE